MLEWEELLEDIEYEPVYGALQAGILLLEKYYHRADNTDVYFIAHGTQHIIISISFLLTCWLVLDPVFKLGYLNAAWEPQYLDVGMKQFKAWVSPDLSTELFLIHFSFLFIRHSTKLQRNHCQVPVPQLHVCYFHHRVILETDANLLALPSMDSWIESMIRKKQMKKGTPLASQPASESNGDPFEELNRYLKQPRLRQEDCPNPIPWWGVSNS